MGRNREIQKRILFNDTQKKRNPEWCRPSKKKEENCWLVQRRGRGRGCGGGGGGEVSINQRKMRELRALEVFTKY